MSSARAGRGLASDIDAGMKDGRNLLVTVIASVARALRPTFVVVENVSGFLVRKVRHPETGTPTTAAAYLTDALADGYDAYPIVVDAAAYGVPQNRRRVFLVYVSRKSKANRHLRSAELLPFPRATHGSGGRSYVSIREALSKAGLPPLDASNAKLATSEERGGLHCVPTWNDRIYRMVSDIPPGSGGSAWKNNRCPRCRQIGDDDNVRCERCDELLRKPIVIDSNGKARLVKGFGSSYRRMYPDRPAATVTTASGRVGSDYTIHPTENRLLSPAECALLQTFPPSFEWGEALSRYGFMEVRAMIGEAVPPRLTELHGRALMHALNGTGLRFLERTSAKSYRRATKKLIAGSAPAETATASAHR